MHKDLLPWDDIDRLNVSRKEQGRGLINIDDCVDAIFQEHETYTKKNNINRVNLRYPRQPPPPPPKKKQKNKTKQTNKRTNSLKNKNKKKNNYIDNWIDQENCSSYNWEMAKKGKLDKINLNLFE